MSPRTGTGREAAPAGLVAAAGAIVAAFGPGPWPYAAGLLLGLVVASFALRRWARPPAGPFWILPALAAGLILAARAGPSFPSEASAGLLGLTLLYWAASDADRPSGGPGPSTGLAIPGLALALALSTTAFLPSGASRAAAAAVLLVALLLALGWALARSLRAGVGRSAAS